MFSFLCSVKTSPGSRLYNEDSNLLQPFGKRGLVCAVCDGMGGGGHGGEASALATAILSAYTPETLPAQLAEYSRRCCLAINARRQELHARTMGATISAVSIWDGTAHFFNVGDSRGYLLRNGSLTQVTHDHAERETPLSCRKLTQHLGVPPDEFTVEPFCAPPISLKARDRLLLCSDGLTDALSEDEILNHLSARGTPEAISSSLISAVLQCGDNDNITALVIQVCKSIF